MLWAVWVGLAIAVLAVAFGVYRAVRQLVDMFRALRRLRREATNALEALTHSAERLAGHPDAAAKLQPALARFARDRARLNVLLAAVDDVRDSVGRVTSVYPRK
jgi:hypothetical protein